jgi:phosphate transport system permease protein
MTVDAPQRTDARFPDDEEFQRYLGGRTRKAGASRALFLAVLFVTIGALATLVYTIVNDAFGLTAVVNERDPDAIVADLGHDPESVELASLDKEELVGLLAEHVSSGVGRRLERDQRFYDDRLVFESPEVWDEICASAEPPTGCAAGPRDQVNVLALVEERVVVPDVLYSNDLVPSLTDPTAFVQRVAGALPEQHPEVDFADVEFEFRSWLSRRFVLAPQSSIPEVAGIRTAILGTLWVIAITVLFSVPVGVGAAIYLEEFAAPSRLNRFIQTNINNLAAVPSIIYGMLGLAILVRTLEPITSGAVFGGGSGASENGRTIVSAGITLGLLILPIIIISAQEALRAVPGSLRQAGMALGATRWQTVRSQILPVALPGILTGAILAVARAVGETAPLVVVGAATFITTDPSGPFSKFTALPIQIFQWTARPQDEFRNIAAAAILVLLALLLILNATAVILRNRYSRRA